MIYYSKYYYLPFIGTTIMMAWLLSQQEVKSEYVGGAGGAAHSTVIDLDGESFSQAIKDPANPLWLLKFYAPW